MSATCHVVGAGLAGLSAAVSLARDGARVRLSEATGAAGGRCRSYHDPQFGAVIDNGNHLVLSGNRGVMDYLRTIGALDRLDGPDEAAIAFADARSGERWTLRLNDGALPWWILDPRRRTPGTRAVDHLPLLKLLRGRDGRTIGEVLPGRGPLWERLLEPFLLAVLNTPPERASLELAAAVVRETLAEGGRACRPRIASPTLAAAFVDPAVAWLQGRGAELAFHRRLKRLETSGGRATGLAFGEEVTPLGPEDVVILAVPPWTAQELVPGLEAPDAFEPIVNGHFARAAPAGTPMMTGVIGGTAQWIFALPGRLSVTVSAADALIELEREEIAPRLWADVAKVMGLPPQLPAWQIVKEKRATFAATPAQDARRPGAATPLANLFLAGDWTDTGLPATIEGALRSGTRAAALARGPKRRAA